MIKPLTSFRFVFAFMVFLCHLKFIRPEEVWGLNWCIDKIFYELGIGVSFFFILSGFILSYSYQSKLLSGHTGKADFYLARFARIYPLHFATLLAAVPLSIGMLKKAGVLVWLIRFILNLGLLQSFVPAHDVYFSFNAPSWSISCEMFFYLSFPFLVPFIQRRKKAAVLLLVIGSLAVVLGMLTTSWNWAHALFYVSPFSRLLDFMLGMMLYNFSLYLRKRYLIAKPTLLEALSLVSFLIFFAFHELIPEVFRFSVYYWLPMCLMILIFSYQAGAISRVCSGKIFVYLGEISFGFYLIHLLVIMYTNLLNSKYHFTDSNLVLISLQLGLTLISSMASYHWLEKPANNWIKKNFGKPKDVKAIEPSLVRA